MGGRTAVCPYDPVLAGWVDAQQCVPCNPILVGWVDATQCVPTFLQSCRAAILFNNFHLRHLITLTNLVDDIQPFYHAAEARVIAVEVSCIVA